MVIPRRIWTNEECTCHNHIFHKVRLKFRTYTGWRGARYLLAHLLLIVIGLVNCNRPPRFITDGQSEIVLRLKESPATKVGTLIHILKGFDPDNDTLIFDKRASAESDVIRIESNGTNEALVFLAKELDRELQDEYSIVLTLRDNNFNDYNYVTQSLLVLVEDINDNAPVFLPYENTIEVPENSEPGLLTSLEATDADEGAYGQVVYYLQESEGDNDVFAISTYQGKGILSLTGHLDYETKSLYQLRILAVDRANHDPIHTGTAVILIKVEDLEDQPPEFIRVQPIARVAENALSGTRIMRVMAVDGDRGINNPIVYELEDNDFFAIEAATGWIYTIHTLDREDARNLINGAYILKIIAFEVTKDSVLLSSRPHVKTEVTIILSDVNDNIPTFAQAFYRCEIMENSQSKTPVSFLDSESKNFVYDRDLGNNGTFRLFLDPQNDLFEIFPAVAINEANFMLRVKNSKALDFETLKEINFTIFAREMTEPDRYSAVLIQIFIRDQNDNFPQFMRLTYNVSIRENSDVGTIITQIQAVDKDSGDYGSAGIRYNHLRGSIAHILHLNPISGIISIHNTSTTIFDREVISQHYLTVEAVDNRGLGNRNTAQLIINVEDVNDNAPVFLHRQYETTLLENEFNFEHPLHLEARDNDLNGTENSQVTYEIVEGLFKTHFAIDPIEGILKPIKSFNYEELIEHNNRLRRTVSDGLQEIDLLIRARDSGLPMLSTVVPVIIYIKDVNDNAPIFERNFYSKSIPEDLRGGSSILQVSAADNDGSSPNNRIVYRIQNGAADKFVINSESGIISVAQGANLDPNLTENKRTNYTLTVLAIDGGIGNKQLMNMATVNILIKDVNNKVPIIKPMPLLKVQENTPVGSLIFRVEAYDPDDNAIIRYKINPQKSEALNEDGLVIKLNEYDYLAAFSLDPVDGFVYVDKLIDREKVEYLKLAITVEDLAAVNNEQVVESILSIQVTDENDNDPIFKKAFYKSSITENSKTGVLVAHLKAYDVDKNRTITYSMESVDLFKQLLHLDSETGELLVKDKIDYEQYQWLNFTVKAIDSGKPQRSSLVNVCISVLDENDNNPYFVGGGFKNYTISESAKIGSRIDIIQAADIDSGDFGSITFLMDRLTSQGKFSIDAKSGILSVADRLDRESKDSYVLVIEAWDNYEFGLLAGESRNSFKKIFITITDENDNSPEIFLPSQCVFITEYHQINEKIAVIKGQDMDDKETPNGRLEFQITKGNTDGIFALKQMDPWNAYIYAQLSLHNRYGNYTLVIRARDLGIPSNVVTKTLDICITDFNDHAPVFVQPMGSTSIKLQENTTVGSLILQVVAKDADLDQNALVKYRLKLDPVGSYKLFNLDADTGHLLLKQPLNRGKQKRLELRIEAYDQGLPTSLSTDLDLIIHIRNNYASEPHFMVNEIFVNFTEHTDPGTERIKLPDTIDTTEMDEISFPICYFIIAGNEQDYFHLDPETHMLTITRELDREIQEYYSLLVKASENCDENRNLQFKRQKMSAGISDVPLKRDTSKTLSPLATNYPQDTLNDNSIIKIGINILDINDNPPRFRSKMFTGGITTNADFGTRFMRVEAIDLDEGDNAKIEYHLVGVIRQTLSEGFEYVRNAPFSVIKETGEIQLDFDPQKGMKGYFDFMVLANDTAGMKDVTHVFIYLLREDQKIKFVFRLQPHELRHRINAFRDTLSNITDAIINIDEIKVHENHDGSVDKTKTDLYMHLVNKVDNSIYEVDDALALIDSYIENLNHIFKELNVLDTQPSESQLLAAAQGQTSAIFVWLVFTNLFSATLLLVTLTMCLSQRNKYRRQMRVAQVNIIRNSSLSKETINRVPNTNKHTIQGSNPIWLKSYEKEWFKAADNLSISQSGGDDSLDDNFLAIDSQDQESLTSIKKMPEQTNDLNRHFNVYNQIYKLTNNAQVLASKLETTEL